jgi:hypothetical protein
MEQGPLPLGDALRYARDVANHLRDLHEEGRVHGEVGAELVLPRHSGSLLLPPASRPAYAGSIADVTAFGSLLYEMLTSRKPTTEALLSTPLQPPPRKGPGAVQAAAVRLAERCLTAVPENAPSMQKVLTELRLLTVQARQWESGEIPAAPLQLAARGEAIAAASGLPAGLGEPDTEGGTGDPAVRPAESKSSSQTDQDEEDLLADGNCPRCRCSKVRVSRPRNRVERFLRAIGLPVRRCHRCYFRYIDLFKACLEMPTKKFDRR